MSRANVRAAMVTTFGGGAVAGLTSVFPSEKKITNGSEFFANVGDRSGMAAFVFIEHEVERRASMAGTSPGYKKISYDVALVCQFVHNGTDTSGVDAGLEAMADYDATIENIKTAIRANRTMSGAVFQIGEGDTVQGTDVEVQSDLPTTQADNGSIHIWAAVKFKVIEWTGP